ncbi:MAG: NADH-quinone oxidoreductase subunit C [Candidatus Latescibacterota bacterium]|jgi:NADH-quinone oxidoreductase subunit C/D
MTEKAKHDALAQEASAKFGDGAIETDRAFGELVFVVGKDKVHDVLVWLHREKGFDMLLDIAGVDCLRLSEYVERFEIEYIVYSVDADHRVRVQTRVPEDDMDVPTATDLWQSANWAEREAFEMYGFNFVGHPCLKRLLTHHEFEGHPLRKDYQITKGQWCSSTSDLTEQMNEPSGGAM